MSRVEFLDVLVQTHKFQYEIIFSCECTWMCAMSWIVDVQKHAHALVERGTVSSQSDEACFMTFYNVSMCVAFLSRSVVEGEADARFHQFRQAKRHGRLYIWPAGRACAFDLVRRRKYVWSQCAAPSIQSRTVGWSTVHDMYVE